MLQQTSIRKRSADSEHPIAYLILGGIASIKLNLLGEIYMGEFIAAVYTIYLLCSLQVERRFAGILGLTLLWSIAQIFSDLENGTDVSTSMKGVLAPLVFFATIYAVGNGFDSRHEKSLWFFVAGTTLYRLYDTTFNPIDVAIENPWKWGYAVPVLSLLLAYLSLRRASNMKVLVCLLMFSTVSIVFDFRSNAALPLFGAMAYLYRDSRPAAYLARAARASGGMIVIALTLAMGIYLLNEVFSFLFAHSADFGFLSQDAAHKYTVQATSDLGILLGGRPELLVSLRAFADAPLLGHGSWALDTGGYVDELNLLSHQLGMSLTDKFPELDSTLIPTHSFIMSAMVWAGITGGIFWAGLLGSCLRTFLLHLRRLPVYFCVGMPQLLWDAFFSPFGADNRWLAALYIGLLFAWTWPRPRGRQAAQPRTPKRRPALSRRPAQE